MDVSLSLLCWFEFVKSLSREDLRSSTNVGDKGIEEIAKRSPQLEVLDAG